MKLGIATAIFCLEGSYDERETNSEEGREKGIPEEWN